MIAFGGGGPLHATDVARILGIRRVIAPVMSGVFSAAGMLSADVEHNFVTPILKLLKASDPAWLRDKASTLIDEGRAVLASEGYRNSDVDLRLAADFRYLGQSSELTIPLRMEDMDDAALPLLVGRFQKQYRATYGYSTDEPVEIANLRLTAVGLGHENRLSFEGSSIDGAAVEGMTGTREVSFERNAGSIAVPLLARRDVDTLRRAGPAVIESYDTTIVVPPDAAFAADGIGNIIIDLQ
jgi:N-methylhydantoinase A